MHQSASECVKMYKQHELCYCFVYEIIKGVFITMITIELTKIAELLVSLCDGRPCKCKDCPVKKEKNQKVILSLKRF